MIFSLVFLQLCEENQSFSRPFQATFSSGCTSSLSSCAWRARIQVFSVKASKAATAKTATVVNDPFWGYSILKPYTQWPQWIACSLLTKGSTYRYIYIYVYGGYPKLWYPKTALTPRFREPFAPFRAPAESGHGIMIRFSCANSSQRLTGGLYLKTLLIGDPFSKLL